MRVAMLAVASSCLLAAPLVLAQSSPAASAPSSEPSVPLERLIAHVARKTGKTFIVDPRVRAEVTIIGRPAGDLTYAELLAVLDVKQPGWSPTRRTIPWSSSTASQT